MNKKVRQFFFPALSPAFLIRVSIVALFAYLFFGYVCTPFRIRGYSMEPTYHNGGGPISVGDYVTSFQRPKGMTWLQYVLPVTK